MNIRKIAKEAKVSVASVSRVLNNRPDVSEETRGHVRKIIEKHGYNPFIAAHRKVNVGIVICQSHFVVEGFVSSLLSGISRYALDCEIHTTMIFWKSGSGESIVEALRERRCSAAIIVFPQALFPQMEALAASDIPTVIVNGDYKGRNFVCLENDSYGGETLAMRHLLELGHKAIAFLAGPLENCPDHINRRQAYLDAMDKAGLKPLVVEHIPTERTPEAGYRQCLELLNRTGRPTAIVTTNDEMAYGAIAACAEKHLKIPQDISIVGFDDLPLSRYTQPPLSTVKQPIEQLGFLAAKSAALLARNLTNTTKNETLATELLLRGSTAAPGLELNP